MFDFGEADEVFEEDLGLVLSLAGAVLGGSLCRGIP